MKEKSVGFQCRLHLVLVAVLLLSALQSEGVAQTNDINSELKAVAEQIRATNTSWRTSEAVLAPELARLDATVAAHKGEDPELLASVLRFKATVYWSLADNTEKAVAVVHQIQKDYPDTKVGRDAEHILDLIRQHEEKRKRRRALTEGTPFPDFSERDLEGNQLSVAKYRGKLVLIDFWATWCAPCVAELPNIARAYHQHHAEGFEVIGISLDQDGAKLRAFLKQRGMPWAQYFDGRGWDNKLAVKYGIDDIPATFLLDREGRVLARDLRGEALEQALTKRLTDERSKGEPQPAK